ncbi:unnamed protein product [Polarella glacialis]|uniref:Uncharacterized protein n=1 Tax=Polarella glacialis TaxID=89957 RepID=A0A813F1H6_POLGL|nr:unnamed protein product [Polarella glacialis]
MVGRHLCCVCCLLCCAMASAKHLRIIVTGGTSGIGKVLVQQLAASGHRVFFTGRNKEALQGLASCEGVRGSSGDVTNEADVERQFSEALEFLGGLDALVANAGCGAGRQNFEDLPAEQFDRVFSTNVRGAFLWTQRALRVMKPQGHGQIVMTSSVAAMRPCPKAAIYAASKAAVQAMVLSLRAELKGSGVKIGSVNPGAVATEWWGDEGRGGWTKEMGPGSALPFWNDMLRPEDVADGIMTLLTQAASSNIESLVLDPADAGGVAPPDVAKRQRVD